MTGRLTALLNSAPADEQLWEELTAVCQALAEPKRDRRSTDVFRRDRARIAEWLTRPGSGIDPVTGLPWSHIARYRVIDHPGLGPVPQYVDSARQLAEQDATDEQRQRAEMVRDAPNWQRMAVPMADLHAHRLTWLPRLLLDASEDEPELRPLLELARIWTDPRVQRLLIDETSSGWPAEVNPPQADEL